MQMTRIPTLAAGSISRLRRTSVLAVPFVFAIGWAAPASASTISGSVSVTGHVAFTVPIAGIALDALSVSGSLTAEATGNGEHCTVTSVSSAPVDALGDYPESGAVTFAIELSRGGGNAPDGTCILTVRASGNDGASISARGSTQLEATAAEIDADAALVADDIPVRASKLHAGVSSDCVKWVKKTLKLRAKCNMTLLASGPDGAEKCKDGGLEPADCDVGEYVPSMLELGHGLLDQQTAPLAALAVDREVLGDQLSCQRYFGKAVAGFVSKRVKLTQTACVAPIADDEACRAQATKDSNAKLTIIDNCAADQAIDLITGLTVPDVGELCAASCIDAGVIDRKCLKTCFEVELSEWSDGIVGDVPECGNGVVQGGEACDDGNLVAGDCCSATCTAEAAGSQNCGVGACMVTVAMCMLGEPVTCVPGTPAVEICADSIDNDCNGVVDDCI